MSCAGPDVFAMSGCGGCSGGCACPNEGRYGVIYPANYFTARGVLSFQASSSGFCYPAFANADNIWRWMAEYDLCDLPAWGGPYLGGFYQYGVTANWSGTTEASPDSTTEGYFTGFDPESGWTPTSLQQKMLRSMVGIGTPANYFILEAFTLSGLESPYCDVWNPIDGYPSTKAGFLMRGCSGGPACLVDLGMPTQAEKIPYVDCLGCLGAIKRSIAFDGAFSNSLGPAFNYSSLSAFADALYPTTFMDPFYDPYGYFRGPYWNASAICNPPDEDPFDSGLP